ncbi:glycosyltransferase family 4 protein [Phycisphaera mikurensis]|uniref:Putative glycosyltransferase n=1 Tax=Phycisphaera mikurensis (strain NBRC 102666 / KCTC 22515 / FYK2301M01) TaxID=1142394 RepID=I0IAX9_PHYMF|nr:glycosyltransferase family 4 protein [Phycisphaera mikurensis]MBB6442609.1 glycosyltransferase involved in cell wall biosynthesis [Phycisphaera mikurensis]BAM02417.1 putative glycosyltransferase [Phycisphaera mikurensis NBRC 102666]
MAETSSSGPVTVLGSYPPRRCGIATFSRDLAEALATRVQREREHRRGGPDRVQAIAMNDRPEGYRYGPRVAFEINEKRLAEYRLAADFLNMGPGGVLSVQHEYGIYGGDHGAHVLELLRRLRMPAVATLHTVLKDPSVRQKEVLAELAQLCDKVVVMADRAYAFLTEIYNVPREKIALIPHGIHEVPFVDPAFYKDQFGVEGKRVILTFGLLSPGKGLEAMIDALPAVVKKHPDVVYVVLGATHPGILAHSGEDYRSGLQSQARKLGVDKHVKWFNKFVETDELMEFLGSADLYVTPYLNEAQITSGTLAYALGAGKATISTPYWHAQELLADGRGELVPFSDPAALSNAINKLFDHDTHRHAMRKAAYKHTRPMTWGRVAEQYLEVCRQVESERRAHPRPLAGAGGGTRAARAAAERLAGGVTRDELPPVKLDHLRRLTDSAGMLVHARHSVPDRRGGYRVDDNARALIAVLTAQDHIEASGRFDERLDELASTYLSFIDHSFDATTGRFTESLTYDRAWRLRDSGDPRDLGRATSEDAHGKAIHALGECVARSHQPGHRALAAQLFHAALGGCGRFEHPHGWAYALIGVHAYLRRFGGDTHARQLREDLAHRLFGAFVTNGTPEWPWPNDELTYTAARLPHALLLSGRWMFHDGMIQQALASLDWLNGVQTGEDGRFAPIGTEGWYPRGGEKARFHQLPMEAAGAVEANLEAHRVTGDAKYLERAERCLQWFQGDNDLRQPLYDPITGGCCDRLLPGGVDPNQGADATLSWLLSLLACLEAALPAPRVAG